MKSNKSFTHRLRVTRKGKVLARVPGQSHFNAKEPRTKHLIRKRIVPFVMRHKAKARFLGN